MEGVNKVRVILCGLGRIGAAHFVNVRNSKNLVLAAVVEETEKLRNDYAARAGCLSYAHLKDALADPKVAADAVLVCTPTATHIPLIKEGLSAGKHVFCEKPISLNVSEIDEVYKLAIEKKKHLFCGFQRRSDPSFRKLKNAITSGEVGKLIKVHTISRDHPMPPIEFLKISGGIIFDCTSHDCDVIRWLAGEDPISVYVEASAVDEQVAEIKDWDNVAMIFKFASGIIGTVDVSRHSACGYDQRVEVLGVNGSIIARNPQATTVTFGKRDGLVEDPYIYSFPARYKEAYLDELEHFGDLVLGVQTVPRLSYEDVRKNCIILHAAQESAAKGEIVKIKYD